MPFYYCCSFTVVPENAASVPASTAVPAQVVGVSVSATNQDLGSEEGGKGPWRRAKVVCDYDATCREEMSLMMNEVVLYTELQGQTTDFVTAKRGNQTGRVPRAYIEPLDD
ncbi:Endophilin-B1 [Portunus trituberculatus]|uniref:Endophilin-B1 n=1 Tax=Portunus trituberculatus TaxID=210409 RepID=A0A5B7JSK5_PORTR|nr:Endophilin-B1 [Portunus trituberculatus]